MMLWEVCVVPSLLHGCGTWVQMSAATENKLDDIQRWFARLILQVGPGAPRASLLWETGLMAMGLRVWMEKLMLVLHLRSLDKDTLASRIYEEQKRHRWPGLVQETVKICLHLKIEDVNETNLSRNQYRSLALQACRGEDEKRLRKMAENSTKCERIMGDEYGRKGYFQKDIKTCREYYRTRVSMHRFAGNYKGDKRYSVTGGLCRCGLAKEQESHLVAGNCPTYRDITCKYTDLTEDEELVGMFREILARRDALDEGAVVASDATDVC